MKRLILIIVITVLSISSSQAQIEVKPCSTSEFSQFDFWIGEWDLTWSDSLHGSNKISKAYNDCVIQENFNGKPGVKFTGMSVSTFNVLTKKWHQTWVDDQGSYLDFVGGMVADSMILSRSYQKRDSTIFQRMVWFNIGKSSFSWNWEKSVDNKKSWQVAWAISYNRK